MKSVTEHVGERGFSAPSFGPDDANDLRHGDSPKVRLVGVVGAKYAMRCVKEGGAVGSVAGKVPSRLVSVRYPIKKQTGSSVVVYCKGVFFLHSRNGKTIAN